MPFAISFTASEASGAPIRELWAEFAQLEEVPSMLAMGYPPHVTLAVYDVISEDQLREALHSELSSHIPLRLKFAFFERPQLVFWAAPESSESLFRAHAAVHRCIDPRFFPRPLQAGHLDPTLHAGNECGRCQQAEGNCSDCRRH